MRTLLITLALLSVPLASVAAPEPDAAEAAEEAPSAAVPATVLEHHESVVIDGSKRLTRTIRWTVRVEDPAACAAGLLTPPGLDGASDGGAMVLEDLLIVPADAQPGDTFTLTATRREGPGGHSGVFSTAPDLPIEDARLEVRAPGWVPLHVWFDPGGVPEHGSRGGRSLTVTWSGVRGDVGAQGVWSTWSDWIEPGEELTEDIDRLLAGKDALGRVLAADIVGLSPSTVTERVYAAIELEPGRIGDWKEARHASEVVSAGRGSAVDRAVVLLSLLRLAGHDAVPGRFRPAAAGGAFPVSVPAPAMLGRPVIVIRDDDGTVYIDPAAELAEVPDLPASLSGASVWEPGDLPTRLRTQDLVDGVVTINSNLDIGGDGSASWSATVTASGAASEWLRQLLAPLDEEGRTEALRKLAAAGRPGIERFTASTSGVGRPDKRLKLTLSGHDDQLLFPLGDGLAGEIPILLAPAMAAWLPPNLRVRELMSINPPNTVQVLAVSAPDSLYADEALVSRSHERQGQRQILTVEVERPYRATSPALDSAAKRLLDAQAAEGFELLLFGPADGAVAKSVRTAPNRTAGERAVLEALLWWSVARDKKATKVLEKAVVSVPIEELIAGLDRYVAPGVAAPWLGLAAVAESVGDAPAQLAIARAMERNNLRREAWMLAHALHGSTDPAIRAPALLLMERLQGPKPDASADPEASQAWREPQQLLAWAIDTAPNDPGVVVRTAELALAADKPAEAETLLESALKRTGEPSVQVLLAQAGARSGVAVHDVLARVRDAVDKAPFDPQVVGMAADAMSTYGRHDEAVRYALTAARLAWSDPDRWSEVVGLALTAGDLPTATYAARRASDLEPNSEVRGQRLATVAAMLGEREGTELGRQRAGEGAPLKWPMEMDDLVGLAGEDGLYALLSHRDDEVVVDPRLLAMRAQLHIERGHLDDAARDGVLLATRHGEHAGAALAFAATAGRLYSSSADRALNRAAGSDVTAQLTRMEYRLVSGSGDATVDARGVDDPRAQLVARLRSDAAGVAAEVEGWPSELPSPSGGAPRGFRSNRLLGAVPGVAAWSDPEGAVAIVRIGAVTGLLPPPLANLYSPADPPLRTRSDGGQVLRLDGGVMPLFVAQAVVGEEEVMGIGFTVEAAERALDLALQND